MKRSSCKRKKTTAARPPGSGGKSRRGKRVGKSKPEKADNRRNRIVGRDKATGFRITPDGHFEKL